MLRRYVLIFHLGALGDFVLTWPLALAAGRLFPQSRILYVTHPAKGKLAERALGIESVSVEAGWHTLFGDDAAGVAKGPRKLLGGAHTVVSFVATPEDAWTRNVQRLAGPATLLMLRPTPPGGYGAHASQYLVDQLKPWPTIHTSVEQILRSVAERGVGLTRSSGGEVLIHPGSGSRDKCWPAAKFAELAHRLMEAGRAVKIVLGEVEHERMGEADVRRFAPAPVHRPATYIELLEHLLTARAAVVNDSGPGHLAGVIGVPTLSLFGPTDPAVWRPLGPRTQVIRREPLAELGVDEVFEQVVGMME